MGGEWSVEVSPGGGDGVLLLRTCLVLERQFLNKRERLVPLPLLSVCLPRDLPMMPSDVI